MGNKISATKNSIVFNFEGAVKRQSQDLIKNTVLDVYDKSCKNQSFFEGLNFNVYSSFDNKNKSKFGFTNYPVMDNWKNIYIQTCEPNQPNSFSIVPEYTNYSRIKETTLHELGHIFDFYFATPDPQVKEQLHKILSSKEICEKVSDEDFYNLLREYTSQNGLSDSDEYKEAWRSDVEREFKGKSKTKNNIKLDRLAYFAPTLKNENMYKTDIILNDGINEDELQQADRAREEVFAQLFAYALGGSADRSDKRLITETYKNSYEVVKKYITEYLAIEISNQQKLDTKF